jgi:hypothetical protein
LIRHFDLFCLRLIQLVLVLVNLIGMICHE